MEDQLQEILESLNRIENNLTSDNSIIVEIKNNTESMDALARAILNLTNTIKIANP